MPTRTSVTDLTADKISADFFQIFVTPRSPHPVKEMKGGEFGYHVLWGNIPATLERLDIDRLRAKVEGG